MLDAISLKLRTSSPKSDEYVIRQIAELYHIDKKCKDLELDNEKRMRYHRRHSSRL